MKSKKSVMILDPGHSGAAVAPSAAVVTGAGSADINREGGGVGAGEKGGGEKGGILSSSPTNTTTTTADVEELLPTLKKDTADFLDYDSFFVLAPNNRFRLFLHRLLRNRYFESFILILILISSILLALDQPTLDPNSQLKKALHVMNIILTICFAGEMAIKLVVKGCFLHPGAYWRTPWDVLDGVIVITSLASLFVSGIGFFKSIRMLRVLRPLRFASRIRGMQMVVETLIVSIPAVISVFLFGGFLFLIFGILGTQMFMGKLYRCNQYAFPNGTVIATKDMCVEGETFTCTAYDTCSTGLGSNATRYWSTPYRNFDNIGRSTYTLYVLATGDDIMTVVFNLIDAVDVDKAPVINHNPWAGLYVLAFVFFGTFFWINLLVSVIVDYYTKLASRQGDLLQSKEAKEWMRVFQFSAKSQDEWRMVPVPTNPLRQRCYQIVSKTLFDTCIIGVIMINVIVMTLPHRGASNSFNNVITVFNWVFTMIFVIEAILKLLAMGVRMYFSDNWNKLDFFIILASIPDLMSTFLEFGSVSKFVMVFRLFRIGRMFKLVRKIKGLRMMFNTLIASLPAVFNVGSILFLLTYIYAILGMNIYGGADSPFAGQQPNYSDFGASLIAVFKAFTGDGWSGDMANAAYCNNDLMQCQYGKDYVIASLFYCSFLMIAHFVLLNLIIAVIIDNFVSSAQSEGLLKTNTFVDLLRTIITLRVFVRMLRIQIERMKSRDLAERQLEGDGRSFDLNKTSLYRFKTGPVLVAETGKTGGGGGGM